MTRDVLNEIHKHSIYNETEVKNSKVCGCFYCNRIFNPSEIINYIPERNGEPTAWCPYCYTDAIIGDASGYEITDELLSEMADEFFARKVILALDELGQENKK